MHAPIAAMPQADFRSVFNMSTTDRPQNNPLIAANPSNYLAFKNEMQSNRAKQRGVDSLLGYSLKFTASPTYNSPRMNNSPSVEKLTEIKQ